MIVRTLATLLALSLGVPANAAPPVVRALIVGIDQYRWSAPTVEDAGFKNLHGAVGDSQRFKAAIRANYRLNLDVPKPKQCHSQNAVSITLTDACATRAAILGGLTDLIARSAAGDSLLFYYAGHGSHTADDREFETATGYYQTILPSDARNPKSVTLGDILDKELRGYIDQATAKGINVVTIFDSCNSATATRATRVVNGKRPPRIDLGEPRYAKALTTHGLQRPPAPLIQGPGGGYRVHLGASRDNQQSNEAPEVKGGSDRKGLFTTALIEAIANSPQATFGDLIVAVSEEVNTASGGKQTPQGEGALNATLGGPDRPIPLFDVVFDRNDRPVLGAGQLSGITEGSTFALFDSYADALRDGVKPLAIATAGTPDIGGAPLAVTGEAGSLPVRMVARELEHKWGSGIVAIAILPGTDHFEQISDALHRNPLVRPETGQPSKWRYVLAEAKDGQLRIDGRGVSLPLGTFDAEFEERLKQVVFRIARVEGLLALANSEPGDQICVAEGDFAPGACPPFTQGAVRTLSLGAPSKLIAANVNPASIDRYLYVLMIDQKFVITVILPRSGGTDGKVPADLPQSQTFKLVDPGTYRLVTIASDVRIQPAALGQTGFGARDIGAPPSAKGWTASVSEVRVSGGAK